MTKPKFEGTKYKTTCCQDVIYSQYSGQFVRCKCGKVAVDQTPHYQRVIGEINNLEEFDPQDKKPDQD